MFKFKTFLIRTGALLIVLVSFGGTGVFANETSKEIPNDTDTIEYVLPEIVVKGDDALHSLKMDVIKAEELKFEIFNYLNSTDEFDITCKWYAPLGTRIKKWGCDVGYLMNAGSADAHDMMSSTGSFSGLSGDEGQKGKSLVTRGQRQVELAWKKRALNKEMISLAAKYPELAIAMIRANTLQRYYEAEAGKRNGKNILVGHSKPDENDTILNEIDLLVTAFQDHSTGIMTDEIWARWDSMYRKILRLKSYQAQWKSTDHNHYSDEFAAYVNRIISGK